jgi:hypothetical protein
MWASRSPDRWALRIALASISSRSPELWNHLMRTDVSMSRRVNGADPDRLERDRPLRMTRRSETELPSGQSRRLPPRDRGDRSPVWLPRPTAHSGSVLSDGLRHRSSPAIRQAGISSLWTYSKYSGWYCHAPFCGGQRRHRLRTLSGSRSLGGLIRLLARRPTEDPGEADRHSAPHQRADHVGPEGGPVAADQRRPE